MKFNFIKDWHDAANLIYDSSILGKGTSRYAGPRDRHIVPGPQYLGHPDSALFDRLFMGGGQRQPLRNREGSERRGDPGCDHYVGQHRS